MNATKLEINADRRSKSRFPIHREMRYKLVREGATVEFGNGHTLNIGSGGVAFAVDRQIEQDTCVEMSISWPVLLGDGCPMRLIIFGQVLRGSAGRCVCTIDKYEFRTQAKTFHTAATVRNDSMLLRWAEGLRKDGTVRTRAFAAV